MPLTNQDQLILKEKTDKEILSHQYYSSYKIFQQNILLYQMGKTTPLGC